MSIFADTRQTTARYEPYIEAFRVLFRTHALDFGSIESFSALEQRLASDQAFRTDFTSLANVIALKENGTLSVTEILTIVALAVGGPHIGSSEREIAAPLSALVVFLAGIGGWKTQQKHPQLESLEPAPTPPSPSIEPQTDAAGEQTLQQTDAEVADAASVDDSFRMPPRIQEILDRLELNSVQLKLYLDDIDRRMGRIEPHIEDITSVVHSSAQYFERLKDGPSQTADDVTERNLSSEHIPESPIHIHKRTPAPVIPVQVPNQNSAQISQPIPTPGQEPVPDPPVPAHLLPESLRNVPGSDLKRVRQPHHSSTALLGIILLVLLTTGTALAFFYLSKRPLSAVTSPIASASSGHGLASVAQSAAVAAQNASTPETSSNMAPVPVSKSQRTGIASAASGHLTKAEGKKKSASQAPIRPSASDKPVQQQPLPISFQRGPSSGRPDEQQAVNSAQAEPALLPSSLAVSNLAVSKPAPLTTEVALSHSSTSNALVTPPPLAVASTPASATAGTPIEHASLRDAPTPVVRSTPLPDRPLEVSSVFMTANLLSAPKPPYPPDAIFHGVEGKVVVRALISKSGSVESLRIVSGPIGLRLTTLTTVQKWRFKPYLVNGEPIEVGTTLNVVFNLHQ